MSHLSEPRLEMDQFVEPPDQELECPICLCVMKDAHQLSVCQHMFCKRCIQAHFGPSANHFCPVDKRAANINNIVPAPRAIVNIIARLEVKCSYNAQGCREILRVENLKRHVNGCRFRPLGIAAAPPSLSPGSASSADGVPLNVFVKIASPAKTIVVTITGNDTIRTLKLRIQEKEGIDANNIVVNFRGRTLQDSEKLSAHGVKNSDMFYTTRRFEGGAQFKQ